MAVHEQRQQAEQDIYLSLLEDIVKKATERSCTHTVDQNELRVNSILVVTVLVTAFVIDRWELVAFQAGALFLTTLHPSFGPYIALYRHVLRPTGIIKPDIRADNPEPHRFATLFGTIVASTATCLLASGRSVAGWCAGCYTYYMMNRFGLSGLFKHVPVTGTFPGMRPPKSQ